MSLRAHPHPPAHFQLGVGAVHVWVADLDVEPGNVTLLSGDERARAERFLRERDGRRWGRAREVLRSLLGEYLRSDPRALRFATGAHGKPELATRQQELCFNLAHSGGVALYAVAAAQPVGVDVELGGRNTNVLAIAERAFDPTVTARLSLLDPETREREFLREWVRHEAALKCLGTGLGGARADTHGRPWVIELDLGRRWTTAGAVAAVASTSAPDEVSCREWQR